MHRIRLHGPWKVRLVQKANSLTKSSKLLECHRDSLEADRMPSAADLSETISRLEGTIQLPQEWDRWRSSQSVSPDQAYELSRAFGKPTGLIAGQEVWLVLVGQLTCQLWLNDSRLISDPPSKLEQDSHYSVNELRFPIGPQLLARNRLRLLIDSGGSNRPLDCVLQSVFLEIDD
jgi:hypothetical protein